MSSTRSGSLARSLSFQVDTGVRSRGKDYFLRGAVRGLVAEGMNLEARVVGSSTYEVSLRYDPEEDELAARCTCPYFLDRSEVCKHAWAVILEADRRGLLEAARRSEQLLVEADPEMAGADPGEEPPDETRLRRDAFSSWRSSLEILKQSLSPAEAPSAGRATGEILYFVDLHEVKPYHPGLVIRIGERTSKADGEPGRPKLRRLSALDPDRLDDAEDREILSLLRGFHSGPYSFLGQGSDLFLPPPVERHLLSRMCRTGRCYLRPGHDLDDLRLLSWDEELPWELRLTVTDRPSRKGVRVVVQVRRGDESLRLDAPGLWLGTSIVIYGVHAAPLEAHGLATWSQYRGRNTVIDVPPEEEGALLEELTALPASVPVELPDRLDVTVVRVVPRPRIHISRPVRRAGRDMLLGNLGFDYDGVLVPQEEPAARVYDRAGGRMLLRDTAAESEALDLLREVGFQIPRGGPRWETKTPTLAPRRLPRAVSALVAAGWHVEAEGRVYRVPGSFRISVSSGVDWFDLDGVLEFGEERASLPDLLRAAAAGESAVMLGDGSFGVLPEDWLERYGILAGLGKEKGDLLRFRLSQAGLLDALLATLPEARCDEVFEKARGRLAAFRGIQAVTPPETFHGTLRPYQEEGLGWMRFLREFEFGGCLADDMGLGKTVQLLAFLDSAHDRQGPSLVVAPLSVLWNWKQEAERFTPGLRVFVHAGLDRERRATAFEGHDLVLTTYGTLRRDILFLKDVPFDTVVLDEAQAVKNAGTAGAKAVRLLRARQRLALTGTPVENHVGELWSLFEFLNPGMLGSTAAFQKLSGKGAAEDHAGLDLIARTVRPFILRRKKEDVAKDLPEKTEQTLYVELGPSQKKHYEELRDHYRKQLLGRIDRVGLNRSKIQVLEALLRLRQAACHPGLLDPSLRKEPYAKLDALLPILTEIVEEGHKALVFSQFTRFLAILKDALDAARIPYEYLDGRTRKRKEAVDRFQDDPACPLFLISLKAGGLGLNLTGAEYVFLLDPWWNPAVEAQAIDRTHRIGQTRSVFAYRLIARDTVEERILELQDRKRDLAASIIREDGNLLRSLRKEDLEVLLS